MSLFASEPDAPLAERLRPKSPDDVVGQDHILGPGMPLRNAFEARKLHSFILWGPPGVGKTTLGRLAAKMADAEFMTLSAVTAGVKEIRMVIDAAQHFLDERGRKTVLFVDEIHSFNKSQQDALLPHVESGLVVLVGGTTEHPGMSVTNALLSRCQVYSLNALDEAALRKVYLRAKPHIGNLEFEEDAFSLVAGFADGDGRRFVNLLEQLAAAAQHHGVGKVSLVFAKSSVSASLRRFDKNGDTHYEQISALHKSIRGSSPNAALYWLARMLDGGVDARYIARRLVVIASEDVGNADPRALQLALNAAEAYERLGAAEGERALAQAAVYLSLAPKSNAVYLAWNSAKAFVREDASRPVPLHLRNAPTKLMQQMGYKEGYRYAHNEPNAYAAGENYFPEGMADPQWYQPVERGMEIKLGEKLKWLQSLDEAARKP